MAPSMGAFLAKTLGVPVMESERLPVGTAVASAGRVMMHPLDVIAVKYSKDPLGRLAAVAEYFTARAHRDLDALAERAQAPGYGRHRRLGVWAGALAEASQLTSWCDLPHPPGRQSGAEVDHLAPGGFVPGDGEHSMVMVAREEPLPHEHFIPLGVPSLGRSARIWRGMLGGDW
ncbi:hypothetical protein MUN78_07055 [Leucobacter allii]|uniref:Uncharacterized protein n=1 Tax=Leucobacter allii TaxID=2932247 RepID=A0ABY4FQL6_9MICO|nr:hypothetical protein [Leucobacter allii]UOQ58575.1 hypothetical protein MUN78_07055 [Leucobacter allii]